MNAQDAAEHALLVAQIRGRIPKRVHLPNRYDQGVTTFEWQPDLQQYVELRSNEEIEHGKPVRNYTASARPGI